MTPVADDTIFALATGPAPGPVAVIRISGPGADAALVALGGPADGAARRALRLRLRDPASSEVLDEALAIRFPGPASYTGEDVVELHLHGGRAVVAGVVDSLSKHCRARPAEPGEFTRRAFRNGRLDLSGAEAVADLVAAETAAQRRQALDQAAGGLTRRTEAWRGRLLRAMADVEAALDFADEGLPAALETRRRGEIDAVLAEMRGALGDGGAGERLREGFLVAVIGAPNVGKSSLVNRLAGREAAIVSARAGTTRDVVEVRLDLGGWPLTVADTAGLREAGDDIEVEGVRRARARAEAADLVLLVVEAGAAGAAGAAGTTRATGATGAPAGFIVDERTLVVINKIDIETDKADGGPPAAARVSALTGEGVEALCGRLVEEISRRWPAAGNGALTRARHRRALEDAVAALERFLEAGEAELAAEDLRLAGRALGRITGTVDVEDVLDTIFREFCIGK